MQIRTQIYVVPCPYLPDLVFYQEYFIRTRLNGATWDDFLKKGWRHFGSFFFRPQCHGCRACIPLRVLVDELTPSPSQKRVLRKNQNTRVEFVKDEPDEAVYEIYREHKKFRFQSRVEDIYAFKSSFTLRITKGLLSKYYVGDELVAVGFLDVTPQAFSSIYFIYKEAYQHLSLGTFSVFAESREAARRGLRYYYLGYWIQENHFMNYKANFKPHEIMDWEDYRWKQPPLPSLP